MSIPTEEFLAGVPDGAAAPIETAGADAVEAQADAPAEDGPRGVATNVTPSGIEVYYQAGPKRLYRLRKAEFVENSDERRSINKIDGEWLEAPSVSTILGVLDKSGALTWWGMRVGITAVVELWKRGLMPPGLTPASYELETLEPLVVQNKLSTNHVKDEASSRGVQVHTAFEQWADDQRITPQPAVYPEAQQGYVTGLATFLSELTAGGVSGVEAEVMVGSIEHCFAGRYDLRLTLENPVEVTTRIYDKKAPKREVIPAGRYLLDLKTSKGVYDTHFLQLEGYDKASIECGYEPTDFTGVVHVTADGRYELALNLTNDGTESYATFEEFLAVKGAYDAVAAIKRRKR